MKYARRSLDISRINYEYTHNLNKLTAHTEIDQCLNMSFVK